MAASSPAPTALLYIIHISNLFLPLFPLRTWKHPSLDCPLIVQIIYAKLNYTLIILYTFAELHTYLYLSESTINAYVQSHYREVPRWETFMKQELRLWPDLGQMADFPAFIASKSFDL